MSFLQAFRDSLFRADDLDGESGVGDYAILLCRSRPVIQDIVKDAGCFGDCLTAIQFRFRCAGETYQLLGVYNLPLLRLYSYTYQESGTRFAVVHSLDG